MKSRNVFAMLCVLAAYASAQADSKSKKPTPIFTFTDDRGVQVLNNNLKRLADFDVVFASVVNVSPGMSRATMTFTAPLAQVDYVVTVTPGWSTNFQVLQKTTTGYILGFTNPTALSSLDTAALR